MKDVINILQIVKIYNYFNETVKYIAQSRISNDLGMKIKSQYITVFHRMHQLIKSNVDRDFRCVNSIYGLNTYYTGLKIVCKLLNDYNVI